MEKLKLADLMKLEDYIQMRDEFRKKIMAHKKNRVIHLGDNMTIHFEDRLVMQYQVQEMLRAEKIVDLDGIQEELSAYNPLIPDGRNWKATMMVEFSDVEERKAKLQELIGVDKQLWVQVDGYEKIYAITNEDMQRENDEKTSAVHFMRFELTDDMVAALRQNTPLRVGCAHKNYKVERVISDACRVSLMADLD